MIVGPPPAVVEESSADASFDPLDDRRPTGPPGPSSPPPSRNACIAAWAAEDDSGVKVGEGADESREGRGEARADTVRGEETFDEPAAATATAGSEGGDGAIWFVPAMETSEPVRLVEDTTTDESLFVDLFFFFFDEEDGDAVPERFAPSASPLVLVPPPRTMDWRSDDLSSSILDRLPVVADDDGRFAFPSPLLALASSPLSVNPSRRRGCGACEPDGKDKAEGGRTRELRLFAGGEDGSDPFGSTSLGWQLPASSSSMVSSCACAAGVLAFLFGEPLVGVDAVADVGHMCSGARLQGKR